jgi:hypothetical protein
MSMSLRTPKPSCFSAAVTLSIACANGTGDGDVFAVH